MSPETRAWVRTIVDFVTASIVVTIVSWVTSGAVNMSIEFCLSLMALSLAHRANIKTGE